jgi:hypothetical protein
MKENAKNVSLFMLFVKMRSGKIRKNFLPDNAIKILKLF